MSPLTSAQMRMWFHHILRPLDAAYTVVAALYFDRPLDRVVLERAIEALIERNPILRTGFRMSGDVPVAFIEDSKLSRADIRWTKRAEMQGDSLIHTQRRCDLAAQNTFDLKSGRPPVWFELLGRNQVVDGLVICQHHIITDGWSTQRLYEQLARLYTAAIKGRPLPDGPTLRFEDYAREEVRLDRTASLDYWRHKLADAPTLNIPFARTRSSEQSFRGKSIHGALDPQTEEALYTVARQAKTTPFTVEFALVGALLGRLAEQDDFVVGTPYANRPSDAYRDVLGLFVNSIGLRQNLAADPDLSTLIERARETLAEGLDHADAPIEEVVEALDLSPAVSHNALFQVLVANQSWAAEAPLFDDTPSRHVLARSSATRFDLEWTFFPRVLGRGFRLTWNTDILSDRHAEDLRDLFIRITRQWLAAPATRLRELELLSSGEAARLIRRNPRRALRAHLSLAEALAAQAVKTPERVAVSSSFSRHTYREVEEAADRLATRLAEAAGGHRLVVATLIDREPLLLPAILAILKAGCVLVPLDPQQPAARRRMMIEDAKIACIIVNGKPPALGGADESIGIIDISDLLSGHPPVLRRSFRGEEAELPSDASYILFTSGTTGRPKGVVIRHRNVMNTLLGAGEAFAFSAEDVFAVFAPVGFDILFFELFSVLLQGGEAHLVGREDWLEGASLLRVFERATCMQAVPGLMNSILDRIESYGPHRAMRQVTTGGDRVPPSLLARIRRTFPKAEVSVTYGPTETAILASRHVVAEEVENFPIGQALPNVSLLVADEFGRVVPDGVEGELWIGGAGVAWGYLNRPEETSERFVFNFDERFYRTGDRCRWGADDVLQFLGRRDSQTKIRGFRVELGEIEAKMAEHPYVRSAVAITVSDGEGDAKLIAFYARDLDAPSSHARHTEEWSQIFDFIHEGDDSIFAGWHDSVEGRPLAAEEMSDWHDATLTCLKALLDQRSADAMAPRVLEIGCGTGLLLLDLASNCARFDATDISPVLVERLRRKCAETGLEASDIVIAEATDAVFSAREYDLVILNSVTQYFPDRDYLESAVRTAWARVADGGVLFLGDLRALTLHDAFLAEIARSKTKESGASVIGEVLRLKAQENELLVHPAGLAELARGLDGFGGAHISPKIGGPPNEVTRFRFNASLRKGVPPPSQPAIWLGETPGNLEEIEEVAARAVSEKRALGVTRLANGWIGSRSVRSGDITPASVVAVARAVGADCALSWRSAWSDGAFDAVFGAPLEPPWAIDFPAAEAAGALWTNAPASRKVLAEEETLIRTHLKTCLPAYMTPGQITPLSEMPLTPHGKVDRAALPASRGASVLDEQDPPHTAVEKKVAKIWRELLGLPNLPARGDNFFHLGGTSLSAIRLATQLRADGFALRPQMIFTHQTVSELSAALAQTDQANEAAPAAPAMPTEDTLAARTPLAQASTAPWPSLTPGSRIMLTGATGFLGVHLLRALLEREGVEIHCPVRTQAGLDAADRLAAVYYWYFGEDLRAVGRDRVVTFQANLANGPLTWLASPPLATPHMIIHAAADVRHIASAEAIKRANINGVEAVLALAQEHSAALHHISSIGVAGIWPHATPQPILSEADLDVGQSLTEAYSESKFAAERLVRAFQDAGGKAVLYRAATIAPNARTGRFQQRFDSHFLTRQIKACLALGAAPERAGHTLSLVPVDVMADWIMRLAENATDNATYHLKVREGLSYSDFYGMLKAAGYRIEILSDEAFKNRLYEAIADSKLHDAVGVFLQYANAEEARPVLIDSAASLQRLAELGAKSAKIDKAWVDMFIRDAVTRGCLDSPAVQASHEGLSGP